MPGEKAGERSVLMEIFCGLSSDRPRPRCAEQAEDGLGGDGRREPRGQPAFEGNEILLGRGRMLVTIRCELR